MNFRERLTLYNDQRVCWIWPGYKTPKGYGTAGATIDGVWKIRSVHRAAYLILVGPIPANYQLDHLCRNRACFNPSHLEPVMPRENTMRGVGVVTTINAMKTHCKWDHPFSKENTRIDKRGGRQCIVCTRARALRYFYSARGQRKSKQYAKENRESARAYRKKYYKKHKADWVRRRDG